MSNNVAPALKEVRCSTCGFPFKAPKTVAGSFKVCAACRDDAIKRSRIKNRRKHLHEYSDQWADSLSRWVHRSNGDNMYIEDLNEV